MKDIAGRSKKFVILGGVTEAKNPDFSYPDFSYPPKWLSVIYYPFKNPFKNPPTKQDNSPLKGFLKGCFCLTPINVEIIPLNKHCDITRLNARIYMCDITMLIYLNRACAMAHQKSGF